MRTWTIRAILVVGAVLLLSACHENGTVFVVHSAADAPDDNPGDGICHATPHGCTLRAAVMEANSLPGVELISVNVGIPTSLTLAGTDEDNDAVGDLDIFEGVVIENLQVSLSAHSVDRVFDLHHSSGLVEIRDSWVLTGTASDGAAIRHQGAGNFSLLGSNVVPYPGATGSLLETGAGAGVTYIFESGIDGYDEGVDGIDHNGGSLRLRNALINRTVIAIDADSTVTARASTLADNAVGFVGDGQFETSVFDNTLDCGAGTRTSNGDNLETSTSCGFSSAGDLQNTDPRLVFFGTGDAGAVLAPAVLSAATDHIAPASGVCTGTGGVDRIGDPRPYGVGCDIGAFEPRPDAGCVPPRTTTSARFCSLPGEDLSGQSFLWFLLDGGDFTGADFSGSVLAGASLHAATLAGADLSLTDLTATELRDADLTGADLTGATLTSTVWDNTTCPSGVNSDTNGGNCDGQL